MSTSADLPRSGHPSKFTQGQDVENLEEVQKSDSSQFNLIQFIHVTRKLALSSVGHASMLNVKAQDSKLKNH